VYDFATIDLSAIYFDVIKDRLYTHAAGWKSRRSAQTAVYRLAYALVRLVAPLLSYTADEVWQHLQKPAGAPESVHLGLFPEPEELTSGLSESKRQRMAHRDRLIQVRESVLKSLETAREGKQIGSSLEARVTLRAGGGLLPLLEEYASELPGLFIVSQVALEPGGEDLSVEIGPAAGLKCERCWKYTTDIGSDPALPTVCAVCALAVSDFLKSSE